MCKAALHQLLHSSRCPLQAGLQPLRPAQAASSEDVPISQRSSLSGRMSGSKILHWNWGNVPLRSSLSYTQTLFNKMVAAREFCRQPGMWVFIRTDSLLCMRVRLQLPAFSLLHLAVTELQHVSQPFYFTVWGVLAPLAAVPSTLSNHLMCHSSQWNRFHALVAVTLPANSSITQLRQTAS